NKGSWQFADCFDPAYRAHHEFDSVGSARRGRRYRSDRQTELCSAQGRAAGSNARSSPGGPRSDTTPACSTSRPGRGNSETQLLSGYGANPAQRAIDIDATSGRHDRPVLRASAAEVGSQDPAAQPGHGGNADQSGSSEAKSAHAGYPQRFGRGRYRFQPNRGFGRSKWLGSTGTIHLYGDRKGRDRY